MKYTKQLLEPLVKNSISVAEILRKLGKRHQGSIATHLSNVIKKLEIDTSHFLGVRANCGSKHKGGPDKKNWESILVKNLGEYRTRPVLLRRALIESGRIHACEECGIDQWRDKPINLQVDHRDGDWRNNEPENLQFLCPNCHGQTPNHSGSKGFTDITSRAKGFREKRRRSQCRKA